MTDLFNLRRDFTLQELNEGDLLSNPYDMFDKWFQQALQTQILEPNAICIATADSQGRPSTRIVLLKQVQNNGFVFFSNYDSKKGKQLDQNKYCAANMMWHELERQVLIEGEIEKLSPEESDTYYNSRPLNSQIGAWVSPQSQVVPNREFLDQRVIDFNKQFEGKSLIQRPTNWGGYKIKPNYIEFWQGRSNRLHDRFAYKLINDKWVITRLAP